MDFCTYEFFHYEARLMQLKLQIPDFVIYKEKIMGNFMMVNLMGKITELFLKTAVS